MGQGRAKGEGCTAPLGLALTQGVVVTGGLDKCPLFLLSVLLAPTQNGANRGLPHGQGGRHEVGMWWGSPPGFNRPPTVLGGNWSLDQEAIQEGICQSFWGPPRPGHIKVFN